MPTYAILGGTGNIGNELVKLLAPTDQAVLHVYARSRAKLVQAHPFLAAEATPHKIFNGELTDVGLFAKCLEGVDVVFGVVGTNANNPDFHLAEQLAEVIIAALSQLKAASTAGKVFRAPTVVFVTSAGMTSDPNVRANFPDYLHWILQRVGKYIYEDFRRATALFQRPENSWIPVILFCAPGLMLGPSQGKVRVGTDIPKKAPTYVTYTDLAIGMIQSAEEVKDWAHKEIGIVGAKMPAIDYKVMMYYFVTGLMCVWTPPLWRFGNRHGWWGNK